MRTPSNRPRRRTLVTTIVAGVTALTLAACSTTMPAATATMGSSSTAAAATGLFDSSMVHSLSIEYDEAEYQAMIDTFVASGDKEWISATVTIDGTVLSNVGIKLKGNSTLQGLRSTGRPDAAAATDSTGTSPTVAAPVPVDGPGGVGGDVSADEPEGLPWRIRLDKFVDGQNYHGETDIVVRGGRTKTGLNEAVALELIGAAGLPTEEATAARLRVNGSDEKLRLVIENPDDDWDAAHFDAPGILYKAEAGGDYSYRGDDPAAYVDVFSVEASTSGDDDYAPLISFLKWLNESDDATFAAELADHLDIESFADYLAVQDLVANSDDIDGPGNNSYLRYNADTGLFTVVAWDQNLSFSGMGAPMGGVRGPAGPGQQAGTDTTDGTTAGTAAPRQGPGGAVGAGGRGKGGNILAERFTATTDFAALRQQALTDLRAELIDSGQAQSILDTWTAVLTDQAGDLVDAATVDKEAAAIAGHFTAG